MATLNWPDTVAMSPVQFEFGLKTRVIMSVQAELSASFHRRHVPGERWVFEAEFNGSRTDEEQAQREAFFAELGGQQNSVNIWHLKRPLPKGTLRGQPSVQTTTDPTILNMQGGAGWATLKAGDMFRANGQLFMVTADTHMGAAGSGPVHIAPRPRASFDWQTVFWDKPHSTFVLDGDEVLIPYRYGRSGGLGFAVRFVEVF